MMQTTRDSAATVPDRDMPQVLGVRFDFTDYDMVIERLRQWRVRGERRYITIANPHCVMTCRRDAEMARATAASALTLPDGVGVIWAARLLGFPNHGRVTGPTFMLRCCDQGRSYALRHYFYGGREGVANTLAARLSEKFPGLTVVGTCCPPFRTLTEEEDQEIVDRINATRPDVVWVGLGAPKQEKWMLAHLGRIEAAAMVGVGAAFDFHSGQVRWAPSWVRKMGLEWAYRLLLEPRRMWRRNLDSPLFAAMVILQRLRRSCRGR